MMEVGSVFAMAQQLLEIPQAKAAAGLVLAWISEKVFAGKEKTQAKLKQLPEADGAAIADLKAKLEFALEDSEELRQELEKKVSELEQLLKQAGVGQTASVIQTHYGTGDIVGRDKNVGR